MGCTPSKVDADDTVRRCKERRRLIKEAVHARYHLAAAHSDYCRSLRTTASALVTFALGEPLAAVSDHSPAVLRRTAYSSDRHPPPLRRRKPVKLPHILSNSSFSSSPPPPPPPNSDFPYAKAYSTYSSTPSQASSIWNWDNFYPPPSPPDSEFFHRTEKNPKPETFLDRGFHRRITSTGNQFDDRTSNYSSYSSQFFRPKKDRKNLDSEQEEEEEETEQEEVQCSEWGDHDNCSSSTSEETELNRRSDPAGGGGPIPKSDWQANPERRIVLRHSNLVEIVTALREYFDKAASAGDQLSEMLETNRDHLDRSFKQLRKAVYHSSGILTNLSSTWTSKPPLTVKYRFDLTSIGPKGLCSTLDRLLAWENKLYEEIKAREGVKFEHEKKLALLQAQEYRHEDDAKLGKTKASIKRLQSLISVTSHAVSTTSFAIVGVRDSDLVPKLVDLCHGFMYMWRSMNQSHELQSHIVQQVKGLVNGSTQGAATSELHRQATHDLESVVSAWHSSFCRLIKFQRDFVKVISEWFKLTLFPVNNELRNGGIREPLPQAILAFFDEWRLALDRVPDTVASEAIKSFNNIIHSIILKQIDELKMKKRAEAASNELEKKASAIQNLEKKYYNSYSMVGMGVSDGGVDNVQVLDTRDPLAEKKAELAICERRMEDERSKHAKAMEVTRAMTLNNIQIGLPGVFQAMTSFSKLITEALETACTRSYSI